MARKPDNDNSLQTRTDRTPAVNIVYKTFGAKWLFETFCPELAFVPVDRDEARNPQSFIHVTLVNYLP